MATGFEHVPDPGSQIPAAWHWSLAVHVIGSDPTHTPLAQELTCMHGFPASHAVPVAAFPVVVHVCMPVAQDVWPVRQALAGGHEVPDVHGTHCPPRHTSLTPQYVPASALIPVSVHERVPPLHETVPVWHGLAVGTHAAPGVQALHCPLLQYRSWPHDVPSCWLPAAVHCGPVPHEICIF